MVVLTYRLFFVVVTHRLIRTRKLPWEVLVVLAGMSVLMIAVALGLAHLTGTNGAAVVVGYSTVMNEVAVVQVCRYEMDEVVVVRTCRYETDEAVGVVVQRYEIDGAVVKVVYCL